MQLLQHSHARRENREALSENKKRSHQADTGFTGIEVYKKDNVKTKEVEYKNGIREGITRIYYKGGMVEQEIPY